MYLKSRIHQILKEEYPGERAWKAFIYWWLAANGYDDGARRERVDFVDGANDGGIDAIAWPIENQSRRDILVIQSKYFGQPPTKKDLERFNGAVAALKGPHGAFLTWLDSCRDELHILYRRLREERRRLRYILISPSRFKGAHKRSLKLDRIEVHDTDVLANLERNFTQGRTPRLDVFKIDGTSTPRKIADTNGIRVWIFTVSARELGLAYVRHGDELFAGNIRYALRGQTARSVRNGMFETIQEHPHEFVFSHNGITVTGDKISRNGSAVRLRSATIVNGAQTVSYFGRPNVLKYLSRNGSRVIVKFIEVDNADLLNDIESKVAFRSNNQNKVDPSDLMIELPSLVSLQRYFRRQGVHLERKKGEQKLRFGELGIPKERLAQVLAAVESTQGAVKGKRKQELFRDLAHGLFSDYDSTNQMRFQAVAWARIDHVFRSTISTLANKKRRKRAQLAELASLTVFNRVMRETGLRQRLFRAMTNWDVDHREQELFLEKSCRTVLKELLRCSARDKKNEPAFYKAFVSLRPAVDTSVWRSRRKIRGIYKDLLGS